MKMNLNHEQKIHFRVLMYKLNELPGKYLASFQA